MNFADTPPESSPRSYSFDPEVTPPPSSSICLSPRPVSPTIGITKSAKYVHTIRDITPRAMEFHLQVTPPPIAPPATPHSEPDYFGSRPERSTLVTQNPRFFYEHVTSSEPMLRDYHTLRQNLPLTRGMDFDPIPKTPYQPLPYNKNKRYYAHALTNQDRAELSIGNGVKPWNDIDYVTKGIMGASLVREAWMPRPRMHEQHLSPSADVKKYTRRVSRLSMLPGSISPGTGDTPQVPKMISLRSSSAPAPRAKCVTFDDFVGPHVSGVGEAYRGANNAKNAVQDDTKMDIDEKGDGAKEAGRKRLRKRLSLRSVSINLRKGSK